MLPERENQQTASSVTLPPGEGRDRRDSSREHDMGWYGGSTLRRTLWKQARGQEAVCPAVVLRLGRWWEEHGTEGTSWEKVENTVSEATGSSPDPTRNLLCALRQMDPPFWFSVSSFENRTLQWDGFFEGTNVLARTGSGFERPEVETHGLSL